MLFGFTGPAFSQLQLRGSCLFYKTHIVNTRSNFNKKNIPPIQVCVLFPLTNTVYKLCYKILMPLNTGNEKDLHYTDKEIAAGDFPFFCISLFIFVWYKSFSGYSRFGQDR